MRVSWGWNSILLRPWRSNEELRQFVSQCPGRFLIGESVDQEREFYSATIEKELARDSDAFIFGICSEGHGVSPQLLVEPTLRACFVGANDEVVAVGGNSGQHTQTPYTNTICSWKRGDVSPVY